MKDRLIKFLTAEGLTSAKLADIIDVQPSSISHILSGRNKPGFDFIYKILTKFSNLNAEWLIIGKGSMYKPDKQATLFNSDINEKKDNNINNPPDLNNSNELVNKIEKIDSDEVNNTIDKNNFPQNIDIEKIILFYTDNSFKEYIPNQKK